MQQEGLVWTGKKKTATIGKHGIIETAAIYVHVDDKYRLRFECNTFSPSWRFADEPSNITEEEAIELLKSLIK